MDAIEIYALLNSKIKKISGGNNGKSIEFIWDGTRLGIRQEGALEYQYTDLKGSNGKSAYEIAVDNGFKGTEIEWIESLKGVNGTNGTNGKGVQEITLTKDSTGAIVGGTVIYTDGSSSNISVTTENLEG